MLETTAKNGTVCPTCAKTSSEPAGARIVTGLVRIDHGFVEKNARVSAALSF